MTENHKRSPKDISNVYLENLMTRLHEWIAQGRSTGLNDFSLTKLLEICTRLREGMMYSMNVRAKVPIRMPRFNRELGFVQGVLTACGLISMVEENCLYRNIKQDATRK